MDHQSQSDHETFLSVVAPAYNEMDNLPRLLDEIAAALSKFEHSWEVIITDDASTDGTAVVLKDLRAKHLQLRVLSMQQRSYQTAALDAGLRRARGRFIATLDSDLQNDPADIPRLLDILQSQSCDFVNGRRGVHPRSSLRQHRLRPQPHVDLPQAPGEVAVTLTCRWA